MESEVIIEDKAFDGIYFLKCSSLNKKSKGNIILLHKLLEDKEHELFLAYYLVRNGYDVYIPDLLYHGESYMSIKYNQKMDFNKIFTEMNKSMEMIRKIIDYIGKKGIGIVGSSYGGMIALAAGAFFDEIHFICALCSCVNWKKLVLEKTFEGFRFVSINKPVIDWQTVCDSIQIYDPIYHINELRSKDIIMMNGKLDTTFKLDLIKPFYEELIYKKEYGKSIVWNVYDKAGHSVTYEMINDLLNWLNR